MFLSLGKYIIKFQSGIRKNKMKICYFMFSIAFVGALQDKMKKASESCSTLDDVVGCVKGFLRAQQ